MHLTIQAVKITFLYLFLRMLKTGWLLQLQQLLLCILAFTIPFPFIFATVVIIVLSATWLVSMRPTELFDKLKGRKALWPWFLYFMLFAASYFYSDNKAVSVFDLQKKLSIFLFPLVIGAGVSIDKKLAERIFLFFTAGVSIAAILCITNAAHLWSETKDTTVFFYHSLVKPMIDINAVYMAWYTFFSLSILLFFPWAGNLKKQRYLKNTLLILQLVFFILLSSKTLILLFFLLLVPFYLRKTVVHWRFAPWKIIVSVIVLTALFVGLFAVENPIRRRYEDIINKNDISKAWLNDYSTVDESKFSNLAIRMMVWRIGIENMVENHLWLAGAGNGDVQDLQNQRMAYHHVQNWDRDHFDDTSNLWNVDLHNMYLETILMIGVPGLILIILIMFTPLRYINKTNYKAVFTIFFIVAIFFMMQEASLQTQAGIVYYSFFTQIFWNIYYSVKQEKKLHITT